MAPVVLDDNSVATCTRWCRCYDLVPHGLALHDLDMNESHSPGRLPSNIRLPPDGRDRWG